MLTDNGDFGLTASPYSPATYWLGPNDHTSWFVVDCGGGKDVTHFILKNTRNGGWGDRSTTMYKIETSMDKVSWRQAVATTSLQLSITRVKVASGVQRVRYVRFTFVAYAGKGGGLSYFGCYGKQTARPKSACLNLVWGAGWPDMPAGWASWPR